MDKLIDCLKYLLYALIAYLNINTEVFMILMIFMIADSIAGSIKAIRLNQDFRFRILLSGVTMKLLFLIVPLLVALLGKGLDRDFEIAVDVVMKILVVSEFYSIIGNIIAAKNKKEVKRLDLITTLLHSLRVGARKIIDKNLNIIEESNEKKDHEES